MTEIISGEIRLELEKTALFRPRVVDKLSLQKSTGPIAGY
jgi:hypothetical protein